MIFFHHGWNFLKISYFPVQQWFASNLIYKDDWCVPSILLDGTLLGGTSPHLHGLSKTVS